MADYPTLAATLAALAATETDPTGTEDAAKLNDAIVQTRVWLGDFLAVGFNSDGTLKSGAFGASTFPAGSIRGSNSVGDVQREILQGSIRTIDIADAMITAAKIADGAVTAAKFGDGSIATAKLADQAVTAAKIALATITSSLLANAAVGTAQIADSAVSTAKLNDGAVSTAKIAGRGVDGSRLPECPIGYILVGGNTVNGITNSVAPKKLSGILAINEEGVVSMNTVADGASAFAVVVEKYSSGTSGGTATAGWNTRGSGTGGILPWSVEKDTVGLININGEKIEVKQDGVYLLDISCPAFDCNAHQIKVTIKKDADSVDTETLLGSSEFSVNSTAVQSRSFVRSVVSFSGSTTTVFPYIKIEHYVQTTKATVGMGRAVAGGVSEMYSIVSLLKLF